MRNFKDIIVEKLKISADKTFELPDMEDFKDAIYNFNTDHEIKFEEIDPKYKDIKNWPTHKVLGTISYVFSLSVNKQMVNADGTLWASCYEDLYTREICYFMINKMDSLVKTFGEELVLQIWDYIKK